MWPHELQMSRDECRGILRRLELESYSNVISVFRAQGGLSDSKAKVLEELRSFFHISPDRHRAEARRVANDEQLSTIAEAISGPNTWQEWSREGRRSFPMLARVAPQTALSLIANNVASDTAVENAKLPYPAETATAVIEEQANAASAIAEREGVTAWETKPDGYIVKEDPFKMPDIPAGPKKNLKRISAEGQTGGSKKRIISDISPTKQQNQKQFQHITANNSNVSSNVNASNIRKLYHNHNNKLQQQRYYPNQQMAKPKFSSKKSVTAPTAAGGVSATSKRQVTPAKAGRKSQAKLQEQKLLLQQQQIGIQQNQAEPCHVQNMLDISDDMKDPKNPQPQIAASKKDITKNLSKLQLPGTISCTTSISTGTTATLSPTPSSLSVPIVGPTRLESHLLATSPPVASTAITPLMHGKIEKQLISTPVQKIIIEDRLPPPQQPSSTMPQQTSSSPQIMTLPQISAAATKLRAVNTTILPPGTKVTAKKMSAQALVAGTSGIGILGSEHVSSGVGVSTSAVSQSQVFNIIDSGNVVCTNAQASPAVPTHTPPAIIQLQINSGSGNEASVSLQPPAQSKVLTTKLLPIVLSGSGGTGTGITSTANITKIETLNNGATLVAAGLGSGSTSSNTSVGTTIIKSVPSTLLLSPNQSSGSSTLFSTLGSSASVFRKSPIIKTGTIGMNTSGTGKISTNFNASNTGPQIISNIKLAPAITTTAASTTHSNQPPHQFLHHQLKTVPTTGIRTSVKICQSPNGKVFIQPANVDASTKAKLQSGLQHKLLPNTIVGTGSSAPPQRIAIQKVQIIPAPLNSPGNLSSSFQTSQSQPHLQQSQITKSAAATITLGGNKGNMNMVFMPTSGARTTSGTITIAKGNVAGGVGTLVTGKGQEPGKPNVVIIGAAQSATSLKSSTFNDSNKIIAATASAGSGTTISLDSNQMITEDTPVDILNMPIIVESGDGTNVAMGNNIGDTVTVLPTSLIESATNISAQSHAQQQQQQQQQPQHQQPSTIILGATDWEMELDQATAVAAATKARIQYRHPSHSNSGSYSSGGSSTIINRQGNLQKPQIQEKEQVDGDAMIIDDSFEDVIVEEQEEVEGEGEDGQIMGEKEYSVLPLNHTQVMQLHESNKAKANEEPKATSLRSYDGLLIEEDEPIEVIDDEDKEINKSKSTHKNEQNNEILEISDVQNIETAITSSDRTVNNTMTTTTGECETDAGFDETIVTEIDENTAIEYIEEDHNATHTDDDGVEENACNSTSKDETSKTMSTYDERRDRKNGNADKSDMNTEKVSVTASAPVGMKQISVNIAESDTNKKGAGNVLLTATTTASMPLVTTINKNSSSI